MEPIRVAQILGKFNSGGVEAVVLNYYRHVDKDKVQFDFIIDEDSIGHLPADCIAMGARLYKVSPYQKIFRNWMDLYKLFKKNNYKIVHAHLTTMNVLPLMAAYFAGVEIRISHGHNTAHRGEWKKNILKSILKPFIIIFATHYFACSEQVAKWLYSKKTLEDNQVTIVYNAIDVCKYEFNNQIRNQIRQELGIKDKFVVGHIGRFVYQKNHEYLIDIFREVHKSNHDAILVLIGEGKLEQAIKEKVKKMGMNDCVYFLGVRSDVNELLQAFDVFVLPSFYEGLPVVGVEAQMNGLPMVIADTVTKEVKISNNIRFISLKSSTLEWCDAILNTKRLKDMKVLDEKFDIGKQAVKLQKIYMELLK